MENIKKLSDIVKIEPEFPDTTQKKSEELLGHTLVLEGVVFKIGDNGEFVIIRAYDKNTSEDISFANGGVVVVETLKRLCDKQDLKSLTNTKIMFKEKVSCTLAYPMGKNGRKYFTLE